MSPEQITQWAKEAGGCQLADYDCAFALNLGSLTRFAALIREADRLHDLTDKEIEALRAALAEPQECTWTPDLRGVTTTGCGLNDVLIMEGTRAVYCFNCGKKIKFVEGGVMSDKPQNNAIKNFDPNPSGSQDWLATQTSNAYNLDGFPVSIGATTLPCEIVWQGAIHANVGVLLRVTGIHGKYLYVEQAEPLRDLTDREIKEIANQSDLVEELADWATEYGADTDRAIAQAEKDLIQFARAIIESARKK